MSPLILLVPAGKHSGTSIKATIYIYVDKATGTVDNFLAGFPLLCTLLSFAKSIKPTLNVGGCMERASFFFFTFGYLSILYGARRHRGWVCQLQRNFFCMGIRENSTVGLGASTIMGVDLPISID
ncbi:hypothetical protein P167DRAFT_63244 [Morchella conica CCBAS932]|uniref:Uncharacterized protein n=1 Tax=Morchella conica CCBAS932 TaxID=1392247 RepID=A0A3N4KUS4_9PEZI|nr:hypothetical protein P167DRAFT_63244 [Morchella conica CCBAS932]